MAKYLDNDGLLYLWQKIKNVFATKDSLDGKVDKVTGKGLSTNDYTTTEKTKLAGISVTYDAESHVSTIADGTGSAVGVINADYLTQTVLPHSYYNKTEVSGMFSEALTTVSGMISSAVTNMYKYKGSVATVSALPSSGNTTGDVYNVEANGMNYAWNGTEWDALGETFSISSISNSDIDTIVAS